MALGANLRIASPLGTRDLPVEEFFLGPGRNALQPNEILLQVRIPAQPANSGAFYHRFIPRNEMDIAVVSAGVRLVLNADGSRIESARLALGAVAATPLLVPVDAIAGLVPDAATFAIAGNIAEDAATPIADMRGSIFQRKKLASVLTIRALEGALSRATEAR
jgi:carbon-monoxide dehydrogenase medium subunit